MSTTSGNDSGRWGISARPELGLDIWLDNSAESKVHGDPKKKQSVLIRTISRNKKVRSALFHVSNDVTLIPTFSQGADFASIAQENFDDEQIIYSPPSHIPPRVAQAVASRRIVGDRRRLNNPFKRRSSPASIPVKPYQRSSAAANGFKVVKGVSYGLLAVFILLIGFQVIQLRVVLSGSMLPVLKIGDVVVVESTKYRQPKLNDIVLYTARALDGTPVTTYAHRIIDGNKQDGWIIKGDNNDQPDYGVKKNSDVTGVVLFNIPKVGRILSPIPIALILIGGWLISLAGGKLRRILADESKY
jgi:signal peptidase I